MATKITAYVPTSVRDRYHVNDAISTLRLICGGMSEHEIEGSWIGSDGLVVEPVKVISWLNADEVKSQAIEGALRRLSAEMIELGEESVLVERIQVDAEFRSA